MKIPEGAVQAAHVALAGAFDRLGDDGEMTYHELASVILEAALPYIQAQTLDEAVDAFPLETIRAPDNAVVWMHRRAQDIRKGAG